MPTPSPWVSTPAPSGTYNLTSGGSLAALTEYIGDSGTGTFTQSGGTHSTVGFNLGINASGSGTYTLSGGSLSAQYQENIGVSGTGSLHPERRHQHRPIP